MKINKNSAVEKFQLGMSVGLAKYYSDAISDNVKRAFEQKRRNGEWTGLACIGYKNISIDKNQLQKDIAIDSQKGHIVKNIFDMYATGNYSLKTIKVETEKLGLKLSKSFIKNILSNPFYSGVALSKKYGSYPHKYPCLISKEIFDKCQEISTNKMSTHKDLQCKAE